MITLLYISRELPLLELESKQLRPCKKPQQETNLVRAFLCR